MTKYFSIYLDVKNHFYRFFKYYSLFVYLIRKNKQNLFCNVTLSNGYNLYFEKEL